MTDDTVVLIFPENRTQRVMVKGTPAIRVDTGMTRFQFMEMALRYAAGDTNFLSAVFTKEDE